MLDFSSGEGLTARRNEMFLIDGQAFNQRDFGNYAWAIGMRLAGYDYATIRTLAELNGAVGTYAQNEDNTGSIAAPPVPLRKPHADKDGRQYYKADQKNRIIVAAGDSRPDQDAIERGFHSAAADRLASALDREVEAAGCKALREQLQAPLDAWGKARKDAAVTN